jgi:hypothetical protein
MLVASSFPTSRPSTYPAEKLMAEKSTTTPALMTQVITADDVSELPDRRLFLVDEWLDPRSLDALDRRFTLVEEASRGGWGETGWGGCLGTCASDRVSSSLASAPIATDSDTNLKEDGCALEGPIGAG